jgi:hypothetical protein
LVEEVVGQDRRAAVFLEAAADSAAAVHQEAGK